MASGMKNSDVAEIGGRHHGRVFDSAKGFPIWREFLWGALAGAFGESIMHPVDTTKTRMQSAAFVGGIQKPKSIRQMVKTVWVTDGFRGFYRGVTPGITGSLATGATYFGVIESTKKWLEKNPSLEGHWAHFIAGAVGDTLGSFIYVPCEVMKQRMQVQGTKRSWNSMISKDNASSLKSGTNMYEYYTGIFQAGTSIWKREGLRGLYEGYWSTLMRDVPFAGLMVMFYEALKDTVEYGKRRWALGSRWQDQNSFEGLVLGGVAGGVSAYMTTPLDVIKTRLQPWFSVPTSANFILLPLLQSSSKMGNRHQMLLLLSSFLLLVAVRTEAQDSQPNITGYTCTNSSSPCETYVFYRAQAPDYLDLLNISSLFGVQRVQIATASNLSTTTISVAHGQSLLIPITCGCMGNYSQANITYTIFKDDTYYLVSTRNFENLTTYQAVEVANPTLKPTDLQIGVQVIFPIRCKCPSQAQVKNGTKMLITYTVQPVDNQSSIGKKFGSDLQNFQSLNGMNSTLTPYTTVLVPVSQRPVLSQPVSASPPPPPPPPAATSGNNTTSGGGSNKGVVIGASLGGAVALVCVALLVFCVLRNRGRSHKQTSISEGPKPPSPAIENTKRNLISGISDCIEKSFLYSIEDLQKATQNFSPSSNIGGSVYKGTIDGKDYAIKIMKGDISQELRLLQKVNHTNLVKLEGFCVSSEGHSYLVYEYVENGSLSIWLHDPESVQDMSAFGWSSSSLPWKMKLQIALDVANGLHYIHNHTTPSVVHKDIKSSNILLDGKFRAKIANFGMAKSGINVLTKHITGTQGYMAPEYLADGFVSPMLDVFAFGVVLLELISGKEAIVREGGVPLAGKAGLLWTQINPLLEAEDREEKLRKWVDGNQQMGYSIDIVLGLAIIAGACVEEDPGARPTLPEIVYKLSNLLEACASIPDENFEVSTSVEGR